MSASAKSPAWTAMLNYTEKTWMFGPKSRADSKDFFVSEDGKTSPVHEIQKSLELLRTETAPYKDESFVCRFPARANFLNTTLKLGLSFDRSACTNYQEWRTRVKADRASLVFSSFYMGNPSSSFGHILLRLGTRSKGTEVQKELLDQGINYGASPWTENPVLYALLGLTGAFPGNFIALPYYYKVREYNDYESRDLWEYELQLTGSEVDNMIDLLWEQARNHYDYFFLTENCGYYIVALIEAAAPRFRLTEQLRYSVIPSESLVGLRKQGVLGPALIRKSIRTQLGEKIDKLSHEEQNQVLELTAHMNQVAEGKIAETAIPSDIKALPPLKQAQILDAGIDYFDFLNSKKVLLLNDPPYVKAKREVLMTRAELPTYNLPPKSEFAGNSPDLIHGGARAELGYQTWDYSALDKKTEALTFAYRWAFHDFLDDQEGAPQKASLEVMKIQLAVQDDKLKFKSLAPFDIKSSPIWNRWDQNFSWKMRLAYEENPFNICDDCQVANLNAAGGATTELLGMDWSLMFDLHGLYAREFEHSSPKALLGPSFVLKQAPGVNRVGWMFEYKYFPNGLNEAELYSAAFNLRWVATKNFNVDFGYVAEKDRESLKLNFMLLHY